MSAVASSSVVAPGRVDTPQRPARAWRVALPALAALLAVLLVLYRGTGAEMVGIWERSGTFTHAFLVPPIVAWLLWRDRAALARVAPRTSGLALAGAVVAAAAWTVAELARVNAAAQFAFVALLVLAAIAVLGTAFARAAAFPLAFLFFCVPIGEFLLPPLMSVTADFAVAMMRLCGVPVFRDGLQFVIPSGNWSIVEACSGVRYLIASFMVGTLYAYLMYRSTARRLAFMAIALALPVLANCVRAWLVVLLGHVSDNRIATGVDHLVYGWMFFGVVIFGLYLIGMRWAEPEAARPVAARAIETGRPASGRGMAAMAVAFALVAAAPVAWLERVAPDVAVVAPTLAGPATATAIGAWHAVDGATPDWSPKLDAPATLTRSEARADGAQVDVHVAYFRGQSADRKLPGAEALFAHDVDRHWRQAGAGVRRVAVGERVLDLPTADLHDADELVGSARPGVTAWALYWVDGRFIGSEIEARLAVALQRLRGRGDDAAAIVIATRAATPAAADRVLDDYLGAHLDALDARLRATWRQR